MTSITNKDIPIQKITINIKELFSFVKNESVSNMTKLAEASTLMEKNNALFESNLKDRLSLTGLAGSGNVIGGGTGSGSGGGLGGVNQEDLSPDTGGGSGGGGLLGTALNALTVMPMLSGLLPALSGMLPILGTIAGVGLIGGGAMYMGHKIKKNRQAANEQDDDSTLTVDEFREENKDIKNPSNKKANIPLGQAYSETGTFPGMMNFNEGGFVSGPGGIDNVPARLTAGEYVMKKDAVNVWGVNTFETMNNSLKPTVYDHNIGQLNKSMDKKVVYVPMVRTNKHTTIVNRRG